jgi:hypothetical protein
MENAHPCDPLLSILPEPFPNLDMKRSRTFHVLSLAACAAISVAPVSAHAESFGAVCEGALYAGAAAPLVFVGAVAGVGAVVVGGYATFDVGESFYVGFRETSRALQDVPWEPFVAPGVVSGHAMLGAGAVADEPEEGVPFFADLAIDPRLQIGDADTDVLGLRLALFSAENRNVSGLDVCTLAGHTIGDETGIQIGLFNLVGGDVVGLQVGGLANVSRGTMRGIQLAGLFGTAAGDGPSCGVQLAGVAVRSRDFWGIQGGYVCVADDFCGIQLGGYAEADRVRGAQVALAARADALDGFQVGLVNVCLDLDAAAPSGDMNGAQIGLVNVCDSGAGLQLGLWNQARTFSGVQIGLCNVITEGPVPFLPIANASF